MDVWLVTTGSSDVQLINDEDWSDWYQAIKKSLLRVPFKPTRAINDSGEPYRLPARVLGIAYDLLPDEVQPILMLPLLQDFTQELKAREVVIDQIIVLMSDQENIFTEADRETKRCPYWQDTCQLYPILEGYFHQQFPDAIVTPLILKPQLSERGLDDWDAVLGLVQQEIRSLEFKTEPQAIYVSHQAGTPAISSAVQFSSLARFGDRTRFLVSSEQSIRPSEILPSSSYLKGIRLQEARTLLNRHDYTGVQALIEPYLKDDHTRILLKAAIQWNFAKFDEFVNELQKLSDQELAQELKERSQPWWWTAYEAAYLAWIRLEQGNTVEAFFHSFRSIEGAFSNWGKKVFYEYIEIENDRAFLQPSILESPNDYFKDAKFKQDGTTPKNSLAKLKQKLLTLAEKLKNIGEKDQKPKGILLFGEDLYILFRSQKLDYELSGLNRFWNSEDGIGEKRNKNFHQLQGLSQAELLKDWEVDDPIGWEKRILTYLNFIAKADLPKEFESLEEASLMAIVHQKLKDAITEL
ncbi:MAG: hypothetical protein KME13_07025 [Myxacorys californica WJT36-NPBG1]|jgi:hypothetical protein|nr:hypothetical protein [Myxacorys californica WJT36-NPBG1]